MLYHRKSANQFFGKEKIRSFDFWSRSSFFFGHSIQGLHKVVVLSLIGCIFISFWTFSKSIYFCYGGATAVYFDFQKK